MKAEKKVKVNKPKKEKLKKPLKVKVMTKLERLEEARRAYKWWEAPELPAGLNWRRLEHAGIMFAPSYEPHGVKLLYDNEPIDLTPEQEEVVTFFAGMPLDGPQLGNPKTRPVFEANFFADFKEYLPTGHPIKKIQ